MTHDGGSTSAPRETDIRLCTLIEEELEAVLFHKERLDLLYPKHAKELTSDQLWGIARARTIIKLCAPWCDTRVLGCAEENEFF